MEITENLHSIKETVDNAMHVIVDEDEIFNFAKNNLENINNTPTQNPEIEKIIDNLIKLKILKTNNPLAKDELEAGAKLSIYLINQENNCNINKITSFLSNNL